MGSVIVVIFGRTSYQAGSSGPAWRRYDDRERGGVTGEPQPPVRGTSTTRRFGSSPIDCVTTPG